MAYGRWPGVDPLAEKYYPHSPYSYAGNNPIRNVDPDGRDWYSYQESFVNNNGEEQIRTMYTYRDYQLSNEEMKAQGLSWIGITGKTKDGSQYLSLFGESINTKTADGKQNLIADMVSKLDRAIINSYEDTYNRENYDWAANANVPYESAGYTDMGGFKSITAADVQSGRHIVKFNYAGGEVIYIMSNGMKNGYFAWSGDTGVVRPVGGYNLKLGSGIAASVKSGNEPRSYWLFPNTQSWNEAQNKANKLLGKGNRRW